MNSLRRFSSILSRSAAAHDDVQPNNSDPSASRPPPRHRPTGSFDHPRVHQQQHTAARALDQDGYGRGRVPEDCKFMQSVLLVSLFARWRTHLPCPPPLHQLRQSPSVNRLPRCSLPVQELATDYPTPLYLSLTRYDPSSHTWSPSEPGMLRLLQSLSTRMTRLQIHSTARGSDRHSRLLVNCFLTPSLRLDGAGGGKQGRRLKSGSSAREGRVFILASANGTFRRFLPESTVLRGTDHWGVTLGGPDWASGEPHRQIFALKFSKTPGPSPSLSSAPVPLPALFLSLPRSSH